MIKSKLLRSVCCLAGLLASILWGQGAVAVIRPLADTALIEGSPDKIEDVTDSWTFSRDTGASDPNWRLVATEEA